MTKITVITEDLKARVGSAQFLQEWVRDGVKLEKVVLQTEWLLLSGRDELSGLSGSCVRSPSGQPAPPPPAPRLRVGSSGHQEHRTYLQNLDE